MAGRTRKQQARAYSRSNWRAEVFQANLWGGLELLEGRTLPSAPVASDDSYAVPAGQMIDETASVLANDWSSDTTNLTACVNTDALNGSVMMLPDGTFYYAPNFGFTGEDSFTYTAQDTNGSSTATVSLNVVQAEISVSVACAPNKTITVSGTVTDASPGGISVSLSGVLSGTVTTDGSGNFSYTGTVSSLGTVTASFTDQFGCTGESSAEVADLGPTISGLACTAYGGGWKLTGSVSDPWGVSGLVVTFGGQAAGYQATVDNNGNFVVVLTYKPIGQSTATTQDTWGVDSNVATLTV